MISKDTSSPSILYVVIDLFVTLDFLCVDSSSWTEINEDDVSIWSISVQDYNVMIRW